MKKAVIYIFIFGTICIFLGTAIGIIYEKRHVKNHFPQILRDFILKQGMLDWQKARINQIIRRLDQELGLSEEQKVKIKSVLEGTAAELKLEWDKFRNASGQLRQITNNQILETLNPLQKEKFNKLSAEAEKGRDKEREGK